MYCLVVVVFFLLGADACMRTRAVVKLSCPADAYRTADHRATSAMVNWDRNDFSIESTRPIKGIYQTVPIYGASVSVNRAFYEGTQMIQYKAVDDAGNFDSCSFTVTITVIRCSSLHNPQWGVTSCDAGNLYGSTCTVSCIPGHSVVGNKQITCRKDGQWSDDIPFCRTTTCPDPGTPLHGTRLCTTAFHAYSSICSFSCSPGYQLIGNSRLICQVNEDRTYWSDSTPMCREITPPRLDKCPGNIQVTTSTAFTELQKPHVVFRTEDNREAPHSCTKFGDHNSYNFTIGLHKITCSAYDPMFGEQAQATCVFTIRVKPNPCRPLTKPLNGFLLCSLAQGGGSALQDPSCRLFCHRGFALPRADNNHNYVFQCDHTGSWQPTDRVPSCVRPRRPQELKLPSEIFYSSSNCSDNVHLNDVRLKFQSLLQATIRMQHACAINPGDCIVEDVVATCTNSLVRKRRSTSQLHRGGVWASSHLHSPDREDYSPSEDFRNRRGDVIFSTDDVTPHSKNTNILLPEKTDSESIDTHSRKDDVYFESRKDDSLSKNVDALSKKADSSSRADDTLSRKDDVLSRKDDTFTSHKSENTLSDRDTSVLLYSDNARHRRSTSRALTSLLPIQFHFATRVPETGGRWPDEYHKASSRLHGMFDYFERHVLESTFTITSKVKYLQIKEMKESLTFAPIEAICDIGYKFNPEILLCVPCGAGTFYSLPEDRCLPCPPGQYQNGEGQFRCKPCPHGTASVEPGAMNLTQCLDIDDCASNPCLHNGRCQDGHASYRCVCLPGYSGSHCEMRVYDCTTHACQNGGTCVPITQTNYTCRCRQSYSGQYCQYHTGYRGAGRRPGT